MGKLSTRVIIAENPYADIDMPEVPSEVPVGSGENISESVCISRRKIVRVTVPMSSPATTVAFQYLSCMHKSA